MKESNRTRVSVHISVRQRCGELGVSVRTLARGVTIAVVRTVAWHVGRFVHFPNVFVSDASRSHSVRARVTSGGQSRATNCARPIAG